MKIIMLISLLISTAAVAEEKCKCEEKIVLNLSKIETSQYCVFDKGIYSVGTIIRSDGLAMICERNVQLNMMGFRAIPGTELSRYK